MHNLSKATKRLRLVTDTANAPTAYETAAGTDGGLIYSGTIDTQGYAGFLVRMLRGTSVNAHVLDIKLQGDSDSAFGTVQDVTTLATVTDVGGNKTNRAIEYEVWKPKYRYYRLAYQRKTQNSAVNAIEVFLYFPSAAAPTQSTDAGGIVSTTVNTGI